MTNPLLDLLPTKPDPPAVVYKWGTVTGVDPLQVQIDTEVAPLDGSPSTLVPVIVGERVYVVITNRRATIIGVSGGASQQANATAPAASIVDSGVVSVTPNSTWNASGTSASIARYGKQVTFSAVVTTTASTSAGAVIVTLPTGYRSAFGLYTTAYAGAANIAINPSGNIICYTALSSGATIRIFGSWYTNDDWTN